MSMEAAEIEAEEAYSDLAGQGKPRQAAVPRGFQVTEATTKSHDCDLITYFSY